MNIYGLYMCISLWFILTEKKQTDLDMLKWNWLEYLRNYSAKTTKKQYSYHKWAVNSTRPYDLPILFTTLPMKCELMWVWGIFLPSQLVFLLVHSALSMYSPLSQGPMWPHSELLVDLGHPPFPLGPLSKRKLLAWNIYSCISGI